MLEKALDLSKDNASEFQVEVMGSFFSDLLEYAQSICLTPRKAAVIVSILHATFAAMRRRSKTAALPGEPCSVSECFQEYKRLLLAHTFAAATAQGSGSLGIFTAPELRQLTNHVSGTLFEHFLLYQSVLVCLPASTSEKTEVVLDRPQPPPDLRKARLRKKQSPIGHTAGSKEQVHSRAISKTAPEDISAVGAAPQAAATLAPGDIAGDQATAAAPADGPTPPAGSPTGGGEAVAAEGAEEVTLDDHIARVTAAAEEKLQASIEARDKAFKV